jgi:hypothetical protein
MFGIRRKQVIDSLQIGFMQFLNWGICTISWRAVAQANYLMSVITDTSLATLTFLVLKKMMKSGENDTFMQWLGYTIGGVLGTVAGIYLSLRLLGK